MPPPSRPKNPKPTRRPTSRRDVESSLPQIQEQEKIETVTEQVVVQQPPKEDPPKEETTPTQDPPKEEPTPTQEPPKEETTPTQDPPKEEPPKEEPAPTQEPPKEEPAPTQEPPKEEPPKEEPAPTQEPPKEETTSTQEPPKEEVPEEKINSEESSDQEDVEDEKYDYFVTNDKDLFRKKFAEDIIEDSDNFYKYKNRHDAEYSGMKYMYICEKNTNVIMLTQILEVPVLEFVDYHGKFIRVDDLYAYISDNFITEYDKCLEVFNVYKSDHYQMISDDNDNEDIYDLECGEYTRSGNIFELGVLQFSDYNDLIDILSRSIQDYKIDFSDDKDVKIGGKSLKKFDPNNPTEKRAFSFTFGGTTVTIGSSGITVTTTNNTVNAITNAIEAASNSMQSSAASQNAPVPEKK